MTPEQEFEWAVVVIELDAERDSIGAAAHAVLARYNALAAECAGLRTRLVDREAELNELAEEIETLEARLTEAERDAERYRWLRGNRYLLASLHREAFTQWADRGDISGAVAFDNVIDAARTTDKGEKT